MSRPRLLDLFCGAGGAAMGYHRAGFDVVGVDTKPQPRYPFEFVQADVMDLTPSTLGTFDAVHASPPCQFYTSMRRLGRGAGDGAPDLIAPTRELLRAAGVPWVIENVVGSPLIFPMTLCGSMFGLRVRRHRRFESSAMLLRPSGCAHTPAMIAVYGDHPEDAAIHRRSLAKPHHTRRAATIAVAREAMGIDWMTWREITQAIPPAFTEFIGAQLIRALAPQTPEPTDR